MGRLFNATSTCLRINEFLFTNSRFNVLCHFFKLDHSLSKSYFSLDKIDSGYFKSTFLISFFEILMYFFILLWVMKKSSINYTTQIFWIFFNVFSVPALDINYDTNSQLRCIQLQSTLATIDSFSCNKMPHFSSRLTWTS